MNIKYINRNIKAGYSFAKVFNPIINYMAKNNNVASIEVPEYRGLPWHSLKNISFVFRHTKEKNEIHHITGLTELALGCWHKKTIITFHDANFMVNTKNPISRYIKFLLRIYLPVKASDCVTCISETTKREILKYVRTNIYVVYNPLDSHYVFYPKVFNISKPVVLHIGTGWNKNLHNTIKALSGIKCHLRIVGRMSETDKKLLKDCKIEYSNVYNISDEEMLHEYQNCDIVNFPSIYEGFGMPIIEGQAVGRCVVTSNIAPMTEIADDSALFVNPNSIDEIKRAYTRIISDPDLRKSLIAKGQKNTERFKLEKICSDYMNLYKQL